MHSSLTQQRSIQLDVIRGVAIIAVVLVHTFQSSVEQFPIGLVPESGTLFVGMSYLRFGVELFFLLSGWLIFSNYLAKSQQLTSTYIARRFTRIWPLWFLFSLLSFSTLILQWNSSPVANRFTSETGYEWVLSFVLVLLFLGWLNPELWNVPPGGWSIQVEVGHYSLFWFLRKARTITLLVSVLVGYATYFVAMWFSSHQVWGWVKLFSDSWLRLGLYGTWPFFVFGGMAYMSMIAVKENGFSKAIGRAQRKTTIIVLLVIILILAREIPIPFGMTYEAVATCTVLLAASWVAARWIVSGQLVAFLGRYSYFIYFAHFWVLVFVAPWIYELFSPMGVDRLLTFWVVLLVTFFATLTFSSLLAVPSWKFFESKLIAKSH